MASRIWMVRRGEPVLDFPDTYEELLEKHSSWRCTGGDRVGGAAARRDRCPHRSPGRTPRRLLRDPPARASSQFDGESNQLT